MMRTEAFGYTNGNECTKSLNYDTSEKLEKNYEFCLLSVVNFVMH